jgi:hypothetical protein
VSFFRRHLRSRAVAHVIYGAIIGLAVVVALEDHPPGAWQTAVILLGTALAVGLAEVYSEAVGAEVRTRRRIAFGQVRALAGEALAVAFGAGFPAFFFVAAALSALSVESAFTLARWSGFVGARLSGASMRRAVPEALAVGAIGGILIALKGLVH